MTEKELWQSSSGVPLGGWKRGMTINQVFCFLFFLPSCAVQNFLNKFVLMAGDIFSFAAVIAVL